LNLTTAEGVTGLYLVDAIGNQIGLLTDTRTTAFRVAYAPYGAQTVTVGATSDEWEQNPYGFKTGNRTDNGVLVKFGMRWYLAITGTWTQRDTLDAPLDPKNANRYGYAGGDPINASDPTGKATLCQNLTVAAGAISLATAVVGIAAGAVVAAAAAPVTGGLSVAGYVGLVAGTVSLSTAAFGLGTGLAPYAGSSC